MKTLLLTAIIICNVTLANAQSLSYTDPAAGFNRMMLENNSGTYVQIGNYKVQGTSKLYGGKLETEIYGTDSKSVMRATASYDSYLKLVEVYEEASQKVINVLNVDSFVSYSQANTPLKFLAPKFVDVSKKGFFQVVLVQSNITLYKYYDCALAIPSNNYVNSALREFDITFEYYYKDAATNELIPIKNNYKALVALLKKHVNVVDLVDRTTYNMNVENSLITIFKNYK